MSLICAVPKLPFQEERPLVAVQWVTPLIERPLDTNLVVELRANRGTDAEMCVRAVGLFVWMQDLWPRFLWDEKPTPAHCPNKI